MSGPSSGGDARGRPVPVNELPSGAELTVDLELPRSVLAVGAHPDDVEFGCGATLAKWAAAGVEVRVLVLTDGSRGSWDPHSDRPTLVQRRRAEATEAATRLGARDVLFGDWPDGELEDGPRQRWTVSRILRMARPSVVIGHDPWRRYRLHPDHRAAGTVLTAAIVAARDPHFFPDQELPPHRPDTLLLWEADEVNHVEAVRGFERTKVAALLAHRSQYESTMGIVGVDEQLSPEDPRVDRFRERVEAQLGSHGSLAGLERGEAFHRIDAL